jgi:phospholipase D1/2
VSESDFARAHEQHGSVIAAMRALGVASGKLSVIDGETDAAETVLPLMQAVADPAQPLVRLLPPVGAYMRKATSWLGRHGALVFCATLVVSLTCLSVAWAWAPLVEDGGMATVQGWMSNRGSFWNLLAVIGVFVLAGLVAVPVVALIIATTALYGIWPGLGYAAAGAIASALTVYLLGRKLGHPLLRRLIGPRLNRISESLSEQGILAVTLVRLLPIAPFSMVNLVAGALKVRLLDYVIGTFLGLLPGFAIMGLVGRQVIEVIREPSAGGIGMLAGLLALSVVLSVFLQMGIKAFRKSPS